MTRDVLNFHQQQRPPQRQVKQHYYLKQKIIMKQQQQQHRGGSAASRRRSRRSSSILCFGILIRRYYGLSIISIILLVSLWRIWYFVYKHPPMMMTDCDDCRGNFHQFHDSAYEYNMSFNTTTTTTTTKTSSNIVHAKQQQTLQQQHPKTHLRYDWTNLQPSLELTKLYMQHQSNCSLPLGDFKFRSNYGLGSDLHIWGWGLCNGLASGIRIRTIKDWSWLDQTQCSDLASPMNCYFPNAELQCPNDIEFATKNRNYTKNQYSISKHNGRISEKCHQQQTSSSSSSFNKVLNESTVSYRRMAALEYLFTNVSPRVVQEAERQLYYVFGNRGPAWAGTYNTTTTTTTTKAKTTVGNAPENHRLHHHRRHTYEVPQSLITVHIRWGDKKREMKLVSIEEYITAVKRIIELRHRKNNQSNDESIIDTDSYPAHIYLATEDPHAVTEFQNSMPKSWHVYVDYTFHKTLPYRDTNNDNDGLLLNGASKISRQLNGQVGLWNLASLLVAMESNDYVLTTASNWSRLMNELRLTVLNPRCGNCTTMIDLRPSKRNDD